MAGRWDDFGQFGAIGIPGWYALGNALERMVTGISSPVDSDRGLSARLRYLTAPSGRGYEAMERAGISVTQQTLMAWLAEERTPTRENMMKIDAAYWDLRRLNIATDVKNKLNSGGGTRIEINPVDQRHVPQPRKRDIQTRQLNIRAAQGIWDDAVESWLAEDEEALDVIWDEIITELGSDYDSYSYVSSIGLIGT